MSNISGEFFLNFFFADLEAHRFERHLIRIGKKELKNQFGDLNDFRLFMLLPIRNGVLLVMYFLKFFECVGWVDFLMHF